jgi:RNA polymerase sigma-70 factor (ECF subfamily)
VDAQDMTQAFFARLLEKNYLKSVEPERGRFRTFLRMALKRFLANERQRRHARKRGGDTLPLSMDTGQGEERLATTGSDSLPPDQLYDRHWALALLDETARRLAQEYAADGKADEFAILKPCLTSARGSIPYADLAARLHRSDGAIRVSIHRMRRRFRDVFRQTVTDTVASREDAEAEYREVLAILSGSV